MSITQKQALALRKITGLSEAQVRASVDTHAKASPIIAAAKAGNVEECENVLVKAGLFHLCSNGLADRVRAYAARAPMPETPKDAPKVPDEVEAKSEPAPAPKVPQDLPDGTFTEVAQPIVDTLAQSLGILSPAFVQGVRDTLANLVGIGQGMIDAAQAKAPAPGLPDLPKPSPDYFRPAWFTPFAAAARAGLDIILSGPAGTGKSRAARELAKDLEVPSHVFACRAGMTRADLFYSRSIEAGETRWELAPFLQAVQAPGVVCLDEVFSLDPEVMLGLNGLLESSQRAIDTPIGTIERHPDCVLVLTANIAGRSESRIYRGAQAQDASVLSRCLSIRTDYDELVENKMAQAQIADKSTALWVVQQVRNLREALSRAQIAHDVTPRVFSQIGALLRVGMDKGEALRIVLAGPLEPSEWAKVSSSLQL